MHIRELELIGFKSFQDKTTLRFSPRMNAVIGPNGCGKTNVLDALRWVMGEQSFAVLRCGKNEDLIFGGTAKLAPTNLAEVRLVLANDSLPEYPAEIEIRRRYFRTGESEYYLNRQACRMRDITDVFLRSGIGTRVYSIFDLRQMRDIISGNVRKMFEEAAALARYREAKADCQRKLELTRADLVRLDDIIAERERVVRSLQRQSGRLRAWEKLRAEERDLRLLELKAEYESAAREAETMSRDVTVLEQAEAERLNDIRRLEAELARQREQVRELQGRREAVAAELRQRREKLSERESRELVLGQRAGFLEEDAVRADTEREALVRNRAELEAGFDRASRELEQANSRRQELEAELEQAQAETARAEQKLHELLAHGQSVRESFQSLLEQRHAAGSRADYLDAVGRNQAEQTKRLEQELVETRARLARLGTEQEEVARSAAAARAALAQARAGLEECRARAREIETGGSEARRAFLAVRDRRARREKELAVLRSAIPDLAAAVREQLGDRVRGEVGNYLEIDEGWERACEAAVQPMLGFVVLAGPPAGTRAGPLSREQLAQLAGHGPESGCGLTAETGPEKENPPVADPASGAPYPLRRHVRPRPGCPEPVRRLIESALVADDSADLEALAATCPGRLLVSRHGYALLPEGGYAISGPARGRLRLERRLQDAAAGLAEAEQKLAHAAEREAELEQAGIEADRGLEQARAGLAEAEAARSAFELRAETLGARRAEIEREAERLAAELKQVQSERKALEQELAPLRGRLETLDARVRSQTEAQHQVDKETDRGRQEARARLAHASEKLARLTEARQRISQLESKRDFLRQSIEDRRRRVAALERRAAEARAEAARLTQERDAAAPELEAARAEIAGLEARVGELSVADLVRSEEELDSNLAELRAARENGQALLLEQRLRRHELARHREALVTEAATEYGTDIANFQPAGDAMTNLAEKLADVRRRREAMGQVNPLAQEEYEQERAELERLAGQRADVAAARENLLGSLQEIDRHARERFVETYALVRAQFREVFREMFLAGDADLELLDEQNPLESEIVITARPRGKNPKRLEQLSDGEKALLAVSLLFAFYRVKPAPFCFLDEIDAPLDDANVGRFADYLKRMSARTQVIIITHNRLTVERAEALFGVTSEQPGVSKLVSVSLADYRESPAGAAVT